MTEAYNSASISKLQQTLREMQSVLVAYSGGTDSAFLAKVACDALGAERVLAVTAASEIYAPRETEQAAEIAKQLGIPHHIVRTNELRHPKFEANDVLRCYDCKQELFQQLFTIAKERQLAYVIDGQNADDSKDFRPGAKAARELGIRSPLQEAGLTKAEIRAASKDMGLPTWDKPAQPCLSTRIPYGTKITSDALKRIDDAETFLLALGIKQLRLRAHDDIVRIEVAREDFALLLDPEISQRISSHLKELGFRYITLDLEGYRQGAMNEVLHKPKVAAHA